MLSKVKIFDGGFGSLLLERGLKLGESPLEFGYLNKDIIKEIHLEYEASGADFITTNTFECNRYKLENSKYSLEEMIKCQIDNALVCKKAKIMFDIGPLGKLLKPLGELSFDDAYDAFKEVVLLSKDYVDGYILETFTDIYELKAAILAVKENASDKLLFATMSFDKTHKTLTGSSPTIVTKILEGLGVDALGVNCSLGPWELLPIVKEMLSVTHTPIIVQANRGLPSIVNGKTIYSLKLNDFYSAYEKMYELGVSIFGGCCGTDFSFIKEISKLKDKEVVKLDNKYETCVLSSTNLVTIENVKVCGERLNPTGKKMLKEALINEDYDYLIKEGIKQVNANADLLDLNVGVPKIDEAKVMKNAICNLQEVINIPFQIDSSNIEALEAGCRYSNGIPIINSVNGEYEVMDKVFPIAKKYGCVILGLTLDNNGVPKTAIDRFNIASRIVEYAKKYGIIKERIIIDTLTLTASAEQELVKETLDALELVTKNLGVKTALGVSNVSFGLPNRLLLNKTFLTLAMQKGLNMPIINPCLDDMMNQIYAYNVLYNIDKYSEFYINNVTNDVKISNNTNELSLEEIIKLGLKDDVKNKVLELLNTNEPMDIINNKLIPTLNEVGQSFENKKIYLPQLMLSSEACKIAFNIIKEKLPKLESNKRPIIMATVKGDVHDIGKNIICVILESYGYNVVDLGKDVDVSLIIEAFKKYNPIAIGLSALMTTTVISMEDTIKVLKQIPNMVPIFVGGAVLTKEIANNINADYYSKDALEFIDILKKEGIA